MASRAEMPIVFHGEQIPQFPCDVGLRMKALCQQFATQWMQGFTKEELESWNLKL